MARDAIARQYDVDKNSITLTCEPGKSGYRPGLITFLPKKGKSLDLDKIEYLKRDALMCGVPYGEIDVDRLLHAMVVVDDPMTGGPAVALREKGLSALESLLFAKYQMYRNVYWHHAVRSATAMYKRLVDQALRAGAIALDALTGFTDEGLLHALDACAPSPLLDALRARRLYKRALECPAAEFDESFGDWMVTVA